VIDSILRGLRQPEYIVVPAKWEAVCEGVIKQERVITHGRVAAGGKVTIERIRTNGGVWIAISVELKRPSANCRVRPAAVASLNSSASAPTAVLELV
jgi:hypothetical protein